MQYPELATVQARLTYRLTSFLLENLAAGYTVEWMDAFHAQRHAAEALGIADRELPWLAPASTHAATSPSASACPARSSAATADAVRPQDLALRYPEPGRRVGVPHELRQARHLHHQPPLPGGAAGEDGRGVAGARWAQQHGG